MRRRKRHLRFGERVLPLHEFLEGENFDDYDVDTSLCEDCPYAHGICWKAGYCIVEDMD